MIRVTTVRHGATEWSAAGRHTGLTDLPLDATGVAQGRQLAPRLDGLAYDRVLTSPLRRAHDTAVLAGFPDAAVEDRLREWDYGAYEGRTTADIRSERPDWDIWRDGCPGGETAEAVARRLDGVIADLRAGEGMALVFAHAHVLRILAARWVGLAADGGRHLALSTTGVSLLGWLREDPVIELWNDTAHLGHQPMGDRRA